MICLGDAAYCGQLLSSQLLALELHGGVAYAHRVAERCRFRIAYDAYRVVKMRD